MAQFNNKLKTFLARELQRQFTSLDTSVGLFIGVTDFDASGVNSIQEELKTRRQIQTVKLLYDSNVSLMVSRVNWTSGTIYQPYSYTEDNTNRNWYVYTSDRNVYACISAGGGRKSIEEPKGTGTDPIFLSNGYIWKFLYKVPENLIDFISDSYIPVLEVPFYPNKPFPYADGSEKQLQYSVQYNAAPGRIENIAITSQGYSFPNTIEPSANHSVRAATATTVKLDIPASNVNDTYNDYTIRIIYGTGAGQFFRITDYDGASKTATIDGSFSVVPDTTSRYEVIPTIEITGDGSSARAYAKMGSYGSRLITSVVVDSPGSNYTYATASALPVITGSGSAPTFVVSVNPVAGLGKNPIFDLNVKRLSILTKIQGRENGKAMLGNDYRQYGLWFAPTIASPYEDANKIAATTGYKRTKVDIIPNGITFSSSFTQVGDFVFGTESYNMGRVSSFIVYGPSVGQLTLDGLNSPFINNEKLYFFQSNNPSGIPTAGFTFTNSTAVVRNTLFEDSIRTKEGETFRCSHKLSVGRNDGNSFDPTDPFGSISLDSGVTGASGGVGTILDFTNIIGSSGDLYLTNVFGSQTSSPYGFTGGETLLASNGVADIELTIESFSPPELNLFSGQLLYISSIDQVKRSTEQTDLFKINIDF